MKTLGVILILLCAGLAAAVSVARPASSGGTLQATVGPGYTISLDQNGAKVTQLDPGTYTIDVSDQSAIHDFHLTGPGVNQSTDIEGTGATTWTVTFANGTYAYVCDAHATTMRGMFTVGSAPAPTTTVAPPQAAPVKVRIVSTRVVKPRTVRLSVTATRRVSLTATLTKTGKQVARAKATGTRVTLRLVAKTALTKGRYVARVRGGGASATKAIVLR
jgi:hypothetical protein